MLEGLLAAHRRYDELSAQLSQPDAASDIGRYRALTKEYKELEPLSRQYLALAAAEEALKITNVHIPTMEEALEFIDDDELVEITPKSIRMRKRVLNAEMRKKLESRKKQG